MKTLTKSFSALAIGLSGLLSQSAMAQETVDLSRAEIKNIVERSYQYVAMYNVNNKFAMDPNNPLSSGGWNQVKANTTLTDHTFQAIARPNNDTLYTVAMLDLRDEPVIIEVPAIDSSYVSLMATGYDHYVKIPMSTRLGDFDDPSRVLFYSERTIGYTGEAVDDVDKIVKMDGDFVSAVYRVMPHSDEPERLQRNLQAMTEIEVKTLSEYTAARDANSNFVPWASPTGVSSDFDELRDRAEFPEYGETDFNVFEDNLLEVMQFVLNHTTFDLSNELDRALIDAYAPLGVVPGRSYDPTAVADIDGALFREVAEEVALQQLARMNDTDWIKANSVHLFLSKSEMTLERQLVPSAVGPIGQPAGEAVYPIISSFDGQPMNAQYDYVVRMDVANMPPANAFWSITLYDSENGFFIPNERMKYSVGENAGYELDENGGIEIHIAAERPEGVPDANWLPINRGDYGIDLSMRIYNPDLAAYQNWPVPRAEIVK